MFKRLVLAAGLLVPLAAGCQSTTSAPPKAPPVGPSPAANLAPAAPPATPEARHSDLLYQYVDRMRSDLSCGKQHTLNLVMHLSSEEAAKFWPIYHDYEEELFDIGDRRLEVIRKFSQAQQSQPMSEEQAAVLASEWFKCESQRLDLLRKYHQKVADALSPLRAAQFGQVEHRFNTAIDLMVASEVPLVSAAAQ